MRPLLVAIPCALLCLVLLGAPPAGANPGYARALDEPCATCHTIAPRLNARGRAFLRGRDRPAFPTDARALPPLAVRLSGVLRWGRGEAFARAGDPASGIGANANLDAQFPDRLALVSGLTLDASGGPWDIFWRARLGAGETRDGVRLEAAWVRWRPGALRLILGQYAWSERLLAPSRRLTAQGLFAYRVAGLDDYAPGLLLALDTGPWEILLGAQNDDGPHRSPIETPGQGRTDVLFDRDDGKRLGLRLAVHALGQRLGAVAVGSRGRRLWGADLRGGLGPLGWYAQWLWGGEAGGRWQGGFYGLDYLPARGGQLAVLVNRLRPGSLADDPQGRRIQARLVTLHYGLRPRPGLRLFAELDLDFQPRDAGHLNREDAVRLGVDLSY